MCSRSPSGCRAFAPGAETTPAQRRTVSTISKAWPSDRKNPVQPGPVGLAGRRRRGACLLLATFSTLIEIRVGTTTNIPDQDTHLSGWDRHGPALLVIAAFAGVMIAGALRGARPAMAAIAVLGLVALLIAVVGDVPDLDKTGFIGQVYEDAAAGPKAGFYLETLGGVLLLVAGGLMLAVPARPARAPGRVGAAGARGGRMTQRSARAATAVSGLSAKTPSTPRPKNWSYSANALPRGWGSSGRPGRRGAARPAGTGSRCGMCTGARRARRDGRRG